MPSAQLVLPRVPLVARAYCRRKTVFRVDSALQHSIKLSILAPARGTLKRVIAIYPGSFDPLTNGHLDLIQRGAKIFDELVVAILRNSEKSPLFTVDERLEMLRQCTSHLPNVSVESFEGLLVDFARARGAQAVLRGIRVISDYEYELQMAWMNRKLDPTLETVFMMPAGSYSYLSSRLVREIASLGGSLAGLIPATIETQLRERLGVAPLVPK